MQLDVLAFGAHPDDVELFCGGLLKKIAKAGYKTGVIDLTAGELGSRGNAPLRLSEAQQAAQSLGLAMRQNAGLQDGNIEVNPDNRLKIIRIIRKFTPKIILAPFREDRHPDHEQASRLIRESFFYSGLHKLDPESTAYRPQGIIYYFQHTVLQPTFIVDISSEFETKLQAISAYQSQFLEDPSGEPATYISSRAFQEFIEIRARYFGHQIGAVYGEPFFTESVIKIDNIFPIFA
jgi:bacillithiol biosynthesis deacetylase BshB1